MTTATPAQNSVNAGEVSPLILGRQDIDKYAKSLYVCFNGIPLTQGGWTRRPGTAFLHQAKHHDKLARLLPFQFSVTQTYILEFGEQYIRFYTNHGILTGTAQNVTGVTQAAVGVLTYSGADTYSNNDRVHLSGFTGGMTQLNGREVVVTNVDTGANTFELYDSDGTAINTTGYDAYSAGGTVAEIYQVATAFAETDLDDIRVTQSADTLYVFHPDFPPQKLVRVTATSWTLSDITFLDGPFLPLNATATTLTLSGTTGSVTVTASAVTGINSGAGFASTDVGRIIRWKDPANNWTWLTITAWTSTTQVTATISGPNASAGTATANWRLGVWSDTTGFPVCGTFFDDRLFLAGAATTPQRLDGSKTGDYENFAPSSAAGAVADDNAVSFTLNSDDVNAIQWMVANEKGLLVGTRRAEWPVKPSTLNESITPTNISAKPATRHGSAAHTPVSSSKSVLFIQRANRKLRELAYVFEADGFKSPDMTLLSEHITRPGLMELSYQEQPQSIVWGRRADGVMLGFTYERDQDVVAWHRHELGGASDSAGELIPVIESIATVQAPAADRDETYMLVQRYIDGQERRYIEYMTKIWEVGDEQEDAFHLDCGYTVVNGSPSDTVTGLWHLEGETVIPYVDGKKQPSLTVTNGKATLEIEGTVVTLGYPYNSDGQTMPIEAGGTNGTAQGKTKRINEVGFWLVDTLGLKFGPDADNLTELLERRWGAEYGTATPLFTGVTRERFESDFDLVGQVYWRADGPFPATVLSVLPQVDTSND